MEVDFSCLKHQQEFISDTEHRFLALVAGYGSGKTHAFCLKGIYMAWMNAGHTGALLEPTNAMAADVLVPDLTALLHEYEIPFEFKQTPYPTFRLWFEEGVSTILVRSAENYRRLAGLNLAWFGVDEADTISKDLAWKMWRLLQSRLRARAKYVQGFTSSTPEGFNFLWEYFVRDVKNAQKEGKKMGDRRIIHAKTSDNPFLEEDYIPSLLENYPPNLITSYLNGEFTNLNTGNVYYAYDRKLNDTDIVVDAFDEYNDRGELLWASPLHIGMDFNVGKCCGIVHIEDPQTKFPYAVDEFTGIQNTEKMIDAILERYPDREIIVYPDASSKAEKTNATTTDLRMLRKHFTVKALTKNPPVKDRINSMNAMFWNAENERRYLINSHMCPTYVEALETQAYTEDGKPDKAHDSDHPVDAGGYYIFRKFPVRSHHRKVKIVGI